MPQTGAKIELLLDGTWTDITSDVYLRDRIKITRGRQDQGARVDPGSCTLTINNALGKYSPRNPLSPLYGQIGRNNPVRVSTAAGDPWLDLPASGPARVRASTPSTSALNITGDLDIRVDVRPEDWNASGEVEFAGKRGAAGQRSWRFLLISGFFELIWSTDGTAEVTAAVQLTDVELRPRMVVRATLDVDNGASGHTARFYVGPTMDGPWTQVAGDQVSAGTTATFASTAPVEIGDVSSLDPTVLDVAARLYAAQIRSGIDGTIVANPDFTAQTAGATSFTDSAGVPWTVTAGGLANRLPRFVGEISAWPTQWDVSGSDVYVQVQAAGIMRRLGQGAAPLDSTLKRRIPSDPHVVAYWPMEETGGTQAYSPITGVAPMRVVGMQWASDDSLAGSLALPAVQSPCSISASVPAVPSSTQWRVEFVYRMDTAPATESTLVNFTSNGTVKQWTIRYNTGAVKILGVDGDGNSIVNAPIAVGTDINGVWVRQIFTLTQSGSTVTWNINWTIVGEIAGGFYTDTYSGTTGACTGIVSVFSTGTVGTRIGHIGVFSVASTTIYNDADAGFDGDTAAQRLSRLTTEETTPYITPYGILGTAAMGPQLPNTFLNLLGDAEDADVGILYEARDSVALAYRPRTSLYNQPVTLALDYSRRGDVAPPLAPTDDDTDTVNDVTVSRPSGSSARATLGTGPLSTQAPPLGVGSYPTSDTYNVETDDQLPDLAGWLLHLGTWDEARYPVVTVNLAAAGHLIADATAVDVGDRMQIANPPAWLPPEDIDLIAQGYTETIGWADWTIAFNCTPAGPWTVGVVEGAEVPARIDTDGAELTSDAAADDATFDVTTTAGPRWVDTAGYPNEFPFDVLVGGERMTVTGIDGTTTVQLFRVTRAVNGISKPQTAGTAVTLADPTYIGL